MHLYSPPPSWGFINIIKYNSTWRIHYMIILVAEFYLPNYVLLRQMSKMSFHFQIRHWWDSRDGGGGVDLRNTLNRGRMEYMWFDNELWKIQWHATKTYWVLHTHKSYGLKEDGHIYTEAWKRMAGGYTTMCWALPLLQALCWASHIYLISLGAIIFYHSQNKSMYRTRFRGLLISKPAFKPGPNDANIL